MMKLLYIALCDLESPGEKGIRNKIWRQLKVLSARFDTYLVSWGNLILQVYQDSLKIDKKVLLSYADIYLYLESLVEKEGIQIVFLRYLQTNFWLNQFLKKMKRIGVKVIIEFPTIPYDEELKGRVELEEDIIYRKELKKFVKYSTNYNGLNKVFGISSISLHNGINIEDIPIKKEHISEEIALIAVATMNFWHGYDRLIKGMADYYNGMKLPERKVILRLVGDGKEIPRYRDLIYENRLEKYIIIEGEKTGIELDQLFDISDIGIGCLGGYRKNMYTDSSIKTKEYCARGIPILIGSNDLAFVNQNDFICRVENDESNININHIIDFYDNIHERVDRYQIRDYAERYLTWDIQFEKLFKRIDI